MSQAILIFFAAFFNSAESSGVKKLKIDVGNSTIEKRNKCVEKQAKMGRDSFLYFKGVLHEVAT